MKRLIALFVMALFLVSIVPLSAFADENDTSVDAEAEATAEVEDSDSEERRANRRLASQVNDRREIIAKKNILMKERFLEARAEFAEKKKIYLEQRAEIRAKIAEVKKFCQENSDSERCSRMKKDFIESDAKNYLLNALDTIDKVLEKRKAKIEELMAEAEATAEVKAGLELRLNDINARLEKVAQLRAQVEAATTKEEIKQLARLIRQEWKSIRAHLELSAGHILSSRFAFVVHRSEALEKKLENTLARLEAKGYDVNVVESDLVSFRTHIEKAKEFAAEARAEFSQDSESNVREGHRLLVEAQSELKLAHQDLKEILSGLKISAGTEADVEIESLSDSDDESDESDDETESEDLDDESADVDASASSETEVSVDSDEDEIDSNTSVDVEVNADVNVGIA